MTYLLPFIEQDNIYALIDPNQYYNALSASHPNHTAAFQNVIKSYICPSYPFEHVDSLGYGYTNYGPTVYTDIVKYAGQNGTTVPPGQRDKVLGRHRGLLDNLQISIGQVSDGSSNTVMIAEDAARRENYITNPSYLDPATVLGTSIDEGASFPFGALALGRAG